jgi:hypothetical protein
MRRMIMMRIMRMKSDPPYTPPNHSLPDHQSPPDNYPFFLPLLPIPAPLLAYPIPQPPSLPSSPRLLLLLPLKFVRY